MANKTSILCIAPFNNPHIIPTYDEMALREDVRVVRASLRPLHPDRIRLGWPEMPSDSPYLQPWRRWSDRWKYVRALMASDIVVFPGFAHFRTLPMHHWLRRLTFKPTLLWSEPFRGHPRAATRGKLYGLIRYLMLLPIHSSEYTLLATGHSAEDDFCRIGMHKWQFRRFAFAVQPPADADRQSCRPVGEEVGILYVGALSHRKGVDVLIEAMGSARLREENWRLTVVGDGELRSKLE